MVNFIKSKLCWLPYIFAIVKCMHLEPGDIKYADIGFSQIPDEDFNNNFESEISYEGDKNNGMDIGNNARKERDILDYDEYTIDKNFPYLNDAELHLLSWFKGSKGVNKSKSESYSTKVLPEGESLMNSQDIANATPSFDRTGISFNSSLSGSKIFPSKLTIPVIEDRVFPDYGDYQQHKEMPELNAELRLLSWWKGSPAAVKNSTTDSVVSSIKLAGLAGGPSRNTSTEQTATTASMTVSSFTAGGTTDLSGSPTNSTGAAALNDTATTTTATTQASNTSTTDGSSTTSMSTYLTTCYTVTDTCIPVITVEPAIPLCTSTASTTTVASSSSSTETTNATLMAEEATATPSTTQISSASAVETEAFVNLVQLGQNIPKPDPIVNGSMVIYEIPQLTQIILINTPATPKLEETADSQASKEESVNHQLSSPPEYLDNENNLGKPMSSKGNELETANDKAAEDFTLNPLSSDNLPKTNEQANETIIQSKEMAKLLGPSSRKAMNTMSTVDKSNYTENKGNENIFIPQNIPIRKKIDEEISTVQEPATQKNSIVNKESNQNGVTSHSQKEDLKLTQNNNYLKINNNLETGVKNRNHVVNSNDTLQQHYANYLNNANFKNYETSNNTSIHQTKNGENSEADANVRQINYNDSSEVMDKINNNKFKNSNASEYKETQNIQSPDVRQQVVNEKAKEEEILRSNRIVVYTTEANGQIQKNNFMTENISSVERINKLNNQKKHNDGLIFNENVQLKPFKSTSDRKKLIEQQDVFSDSNRPQYMGTINWDKQRGLTHTGANNSNTGNRTIVGMDVKNPFKTYFKYNDTFLAAHSTMSQNLLELCKNITCKGGNYLTQCCGAKICPVETCKGEDFSYLHPIPGDVTTTTTVKVNSTKRNRKRMVTLDKPNVLSNIRVPRDNAFNDLVKFQLMHGITAPDGKDLLNALKEVKYQEQKVNREFHPELENVVYHQMPTVKRQSLQKTPTILDTNRVLENLKATISDSLLHTGLQPNLIEKDKYRSARDQPSNGQLEAIQENGIILDQLREETKEELKRLSQLEMWRKEEEDLYNKEKQKNLKELKALQEVIHKELNKQKLADYDNKNILDYSSNANNNNNFRQNSNDDTYSKLANQIGNAANDKDLIFDRYSEFQNNNASNFHKYEPTEVDNSFFENKFPELESNENGFRDMPLTMLRLRSDKDKKDQDTRVKRSKPKGVNKKDENTIQQVSDEYTLSSNNNQEKRMERFKKTFDNLHDDLFDLQKFIASKVAKYHEASPDNRKFVSNEKANNDSNNLIHFVQ